MAVVDVAVAVGVAMAVTVAVMELMMGVAAAIGAAFTQGGALRRPRTWGTVTGHDRVSKYLNRCFNTRTGFGFRSEDD
jgi:hypothetical protein